MVNCIALNGVSKEFGEKRVLKDISLNVDEGELLGFLGPSGAGKTTLIKILTGQISYNGTAKVFGKECNGLSRDIYNQIGMVLDNCGIYDRLSCYDNLLLFARLYKITKSSIKEVLVKVGLGNEVKTPAGRLSKGMKQRLYLARAVLHKPKLLFLDEPTSGLDPNTAQEIHKFLLELKAGGTTIFLTTHNMEEAYQMCDNIALLSEGSIIEYGVPKEICRKYNTQKLITILSREGEEILLPNQPESALEIGKYFAEDRVEAIHSSEPNLETVFVALTGRGLD